MPFISSYFHAFYTFLLEVCILVHGALKMKYTVIGAE